MFVSIHFHWPKTLCVAVPCDSGGPNDFKTADTEALRTSAASLTLITEYEL